MKTSLTCRPNTTIKTKTGSWRTFKPKIDLAKCTGCGICIRFCPEGVITIKQIDNKPKAVADYDFCKGCGICAVECPFKAVEMELEQK